MGNTNIYFTHTIDCQRDSGLKGTIRWDFQCTTSSSTRSNIALTFLVVTIVVMMFAFIVYRFIVAVQGYRLLQRVCSLPSRQLPTEGGHLSKGIAGSIHAESLRAGVVLQGVQPEVPPVFNPAGKKARVLQSYASFEKYGKGLLGRARLPQETVRDFLTLAYRDSPEDQQPLAVYLALFEQAIHSSRAMSENEWEQFKTCSAKLFRRMPQ